jgi:hypothetical protein
VRQRPKPSTEKDPSVKQENRKPVVEVTKEKPSKFYLDVAPDESTPPPSPTHETTIPPPWKSVINVNLF